MIYSGTEGLLGISGIPAATGVVSMGGFSRITGEAAQEKKTAIHIRQIQTDRCKFFMVIFLVMIFGL